MSMHQRPFKEMLAEIDTLRSRLMGYDMINHYAYLQWSVADRVEFDVGRERTRQQLAKAEQEYQEAIALSARL